MTPPVSPALDEFVSACRRAAEHGLMLCSSGNMSMRVDAETMAISASRSWMSRLRSDQVSLCALPDGRHLDGPRPSVETIFHAGILAARPKVNVVLHFQGPAATTLASVKREVDYNIIAEIPYYIGPVGRAPYLPPGSRELAEAVVAAMREHDLVQLANHGQVVVGRDFDDAIQKALFFELACRILTTAGPDAACLSPEAVEQLRRAVRDGGAA